MKIILLGVLPSSLTNFRGELIKEYVSTGFPVETYCSGATPEDIEKVNSLGASCNNYSVARNGLNPIKDLVTLFQLSKLTRKVGNKKILAYTIKPVIWGGVASRLSSTTSFYALVTGLGYAFQPGGKLKTALNNLVKNLYKIALKSANAVIFQNPDNMQVFIDQGIVPKEKCFLVNGSGVDLSHYEKEPLSNKPHFLLIARLLGDKGIREYAKAAAVVKQQYPEAEFHLVGPEDPSPDGIQISEVNQWHESGVINYHGATTDVRPFIKACNIFVLPSYHEGMPRTVLEAMAMGRPVLTTNVPGCKETVVNGENGWLVEKANVEQLAERMIWFIEHPEQWKIMGDKGHQMANEKFDVHKVNAEILKIMGLADEKAI
ncbi:glycosyltransferase family 4 protein [Vibrio vulnificus]|uniref:glycosyltransferase family 4 protein n=1 Tax=Vibrio vulnificus TaxID=672 RepID=UPI000735AB9C|nr:glycosyltransferase family 4 protein [Vibrio vulnificus]EGQ9935149.1 glycosyltransferase family 4 protein [Vibrio vulnificus]EGS1994400.1 glycosyltransferase family 4 protein [Vibrio vulnificus]EHV9835175.1 glycosyltransferase family 4 protein [Vibrio vulnificus]EIF3175407.1 glycosyltransferase family 4 protein [Vibrio vulnificus]EIJ0955080.1 glycosyltransferase family 4 protein [Vibrio vulnificus]